jgi:uncharacterized protein YqhQ
MKSSNSKFTLGGGAFANGVLIKSPHFLAVAKREADGKISVFSQHFESLSERFKFLTWPFIRGLALLLEIIRLLITSRKYIKIPHGEFKKPKAGRPFLQKTNFCWPILIALTFLFFIFLKIQDLVGNLKFFLGSKGVIIISEILFWIFILVICFLFLRFSKKGVILQYHGAEHKSINAYEAEVKLTPKQALKFSRINLRCGTTLLWFIIIVDVALLAFLTYLPIWPKGLLANLILIIGLFVLLFSVAFEVVRSALKYHHLWLGKILLWPALQLQKIATKEPILEQLEVALSALKLVLKKEKEFYYFVRLRRTKSYRSV